MSHDCDCSHCQETDSRWARHRALEKARTHDCPKGKHTPELWRAVHSAEYSWAEYRCAACQAPCTKTGRAFRRPVFCGAHPRYLAKGRPRLPCDTCWEAWWKVQRAQG